MIKSKKGATEEIIEQIPYILLTIIVMAGIYFILSYYSTTIVDSTPVEVNVFFYRALYAPFTLSYTDNVTGRVSPGIIEDSYMEDAHIDEMMKSEYDRQLMAKFEIFTESTEPTKTAYYNKEWYLRTEPLARANLKGYGGAIIKEKTIPILYRNGMVDNKATMKIQVIVPNVRPDLE